MRLKRAEGIGSRGWDINCTALRYPNYLCAIKNHFTKDISIIQKVSKGHEYFTGLG